jgi:hypothetical protein
VNAQARAFASRKHDLVVRVSRDVGARSRLGEQRAVGVLHVSETVDVELEDVARLLDAKAVTGAQVLVDPDLVALVRCRGLARLLKIDSRRLERRR